MKDKEIKTKKLVRLSTFETNSSSAHSLVIPRKNSVLNKKLNLSKSKYRGKDIVLDLMDPMTKDFFGEPDDGIMFKDLKAKLLFLLRGVFQHYHTDKTVSFPLKGNAKKAIFTLMEEAEKEFKNLNDEIERLVIESNTITNESEISDLMGEIEILKERKKEFQKYLFDMKTKLQVSVLEANNEWGLFSPSMQDRLKELKETKNLDIEINPYFSVKKQVLNYEGIKVFEYILTEVMEKTGANSITLVNGKPIFEVERCCKDQDFLFNLYYKHELYSDNELSYDDCSFINFDLRTGKHKTFDINNIEKLNDVKLEEDEKAFLKKLNKEFNDENASYLTEKEIKGYLNLDDFEFVYTKDNKCNRIHNLTYFENVSLEFSLPVIFLTDRKMMLEFLFNDKAYFRIGCNNGASAFDPNLSISKKGYLGTPSYEYDEFKEILKHYYVIYNGSVLFEDNKNNKIIYCNTFIPYDEV